ncbi:MAG: UPF0175 family protein [Candidatus Hermodarchaeota archaeon]
MSDILDLAGLTEEEKDFIKQRIEEKGYEPVKYIQYLIRRGLKEERIELAVQKYLSHKISISGAAELAQMSLYEFLELLQIRGYISNYDVEDFQRGLNSLKSSKVEKK